MRNAAEARLELETNGYCIMRLSRSGLRAMTVDLQNVVVPKSHIMRPIFERILDNGIADAGSTLRRQAPHTPSVTLLQAVQSIVKRLFGTTKTYLQGCNAIATLPGCPSQSWHRDFSQQLVHSLEQDGIVKGYGCLLALTGRRFSLLPGTHHESVTAEMQVVTLSLDPGDVVIFDGRLVHRGEAAMDESTTSYAMHWYLFNADRTNHVMRKHHDLDQTEAVKI